MPSSHTSTADDHAPLTEFSRSSPRPPLCTRTPTPPASSMLLRSTKGAEPAATSMLGPVHRSRRLSASVARAFASKSTPLPRDIRMVLSRSSQPPRVARSSTPAPSDSSSTLDCNKGAARSHTTTAPRIWQNVTRALVALQMRSATGGPAATTGSAAALAVGGTTAGASMSTS